MPGSRNVASCYKCLQFGCKLCWEDPSLCKEALPGWIVTPDYQ